MDRIEMYKQLAERNGWDFSMDTEYNRPYFQKNGDYAVPDEKTTPEDRVLLASIIAEGSVQLRKIALMCWENGIRITGPCSGIKEFHDRMPFTLHLGIKAPIEIIDPLHKRLSELLPNLNYMIREDKDDLIRYDIDLPLNNKALTKDQSEQIFGVIYNELERILHPKKTNEDNKTLTNS